MALAFGTQIITGGYLVTKEKSKVLSVMKSKYPCNSIENLSRTFPILYAKRDREWTNKRTCYKKCRSRQLMQRQGKSITIIRI